MVVIGVILLIRGVHPEGFDVLSPAVAFFESGDIQLTMAGQVEMEGFEIAAEVIEVDDLAIGVICQANIFREGAGIVERCIQEGQDIDGNTFSGQFFGKSTDIEATFAAGIGTIANEENAFAGLGGIAE
jgi:hypothetical protein